MGKKVFDSSDATCVVRAEAVELIWPGGLFSPPVSVLQNINLSIHPGEMVGLSGPSGVGKSTLGDILLDVRPPTRGRVYWGENRIDQKKIRRQKHPLNTLRRYYQKIFQDPASSFPPGQTTGESLQEVTAYHGLEDSIQENLGAVALNPDMLKRYPCELSGGEMQRMALARVMLLKPRFIVADEPTSRLDLSVQAHIIRLIADYSRASGCAVLLISHDRALIETVCSRCLYLPSGSLDILRNR